MLRAAGALVSACLVAGCGGERMPTGMRVTSPAFASERPVPERYSCLGENVPPPLRWENTPPGTSSLAVVVEDADATGGTFVHWIVVGIDPSTKELASDTLPRGAVVLPGSSDNPTYIGPCPPEGSEPHRYFFEVYALPRPLDLPGHLRPRDKVRAIRRAASAGGYVVGTFEA